MGEPQPNPHRITVALDRAKLFGPSADAKVGAVEPDLDDWEAGRSQPSIEQLQKLARLANIADVGFFYLADDADPQLIVARVRLARGCQLLVTMREDADVAAQPSLLDSGNEVDG